MLKGCMLLCQNAEGVHGQGKVGKPCPRAISLYSRLLKSDFYLLLLDLLWQWLNSCL